MKVIYDLKEATRYKKPVVAIGVFDGLHRAHRRILTEALRRSRRIGGSSVVVTFYPHPQKQHSIYSLAHRLRLIEALGIDACVVIRFNRAFSKMTAQDFVRKVLSETLGAAEVYVGRNFRFGSRQEGSPALLQRLSTACRFKVRVFGVMKAGDKSISSTYVRKLITAGKLRAAGSLLSRPVSVFGKVVKGSSLARRLGFPTANIIPQHEILPPSGIYAVRVSLRKRLLEAICYIGKRPTFNKPDAARPSPNVNHIEVHIFGFRKDIYGEYLEIQFIKKIREDRKFASYEALVRQVKKDIRRVKRIFSRH